MRVSLVLAAVGLTAALSASPASAQSITFPAQNFQGGNTDWQVTLSTQDDLSVNYSLQAPQVKNALVGALEQQTAPQGQYQLTGTFGGKQTPLTVSIAPVKLGQVCKDNKGKTGSRQGPYTYAIQVIPQGAQPSAQSKPWPSYLYGCGNFTD
ncbi:hypothetical protein [Lysobacter sp. CA199]|uniref:hypothetical protein n=1 Tax=Lysobacter sp. CA199 TaxID=3455608 RepID=UPI003F8D2AD1